MNVDFCQIMCEKMQGCFAELKQKRQDQKELKKLERQKQQEEQEKELYLELKKKYENND